MEKKVFSFIHKNNLLSPNDRVLVAVSGGADSVCLLHFLHNASEKYHLTLGCVHVNHGIRGKEADEDALFVKELCDTFGISFFVYHVDVPKYAKENKLCAEEAGRILRYKIFQDIANVQNYNKIATAHNMEDNAETVLMRLARGTGIKGMCGISCHMKNIIRPLLCVQRKEIENYLSEHTLPFRTDATNLSDDYTRNKIRHNILPYIEKALNPSFVQTVYENTVQFTEANACLEEEVNKCLHCCLKKTSFGAEINISQLHKANAYVAKKVLMETVFSLCEKQITYKTAENIYHMSFSEQSQTDINADISCYLRYATLYFVKNSKDNKPYCFEISKSGTYKYNIINGCFCVSQGENYTTNMKNNLHTMYIHSECFPFLLRSRQVGDVIQTGNCKKTVKKYMIEKKIPVFLRMHIPVIEYQNHVAGIFGYTTDETVRPQKGKPFIKIQFEEN